MAGSRCGHDQQPESPVTTGRCDPNPSTITMGISNLFRTNLPPESEAANLRQLQVGYGYGDDSYVSETRNNSQVFDFDKSDDDDGVIGFSDSSHDISSDSSATSDPDDDDDELAGKSNSQKQKNGNLDRAHSRKDTFAAKESARVRFSKIVLVVALLLLASGFCVGTYLFVRKETSDTYELSFARLTDSIEGSLANKLDNLRQGVGNLGDAMSQSASKAAAANNDGGSSNNNEKFPFVLVEDFEVHGSHARDRSKMESIMYMPILDIAGATSPKDTTDADTAVNASLVAEWERFSFENQGWIQESRRNFIDHLPVGREPPVYLQGDISSYVYQRRDGIHAEPSCRGGGGELCMPLWYITPPPMNPAVVNFDLSSKTEYRDMILRAITTRRAVLSPFLDDVESILSLLVSDQDHLRYHQEVNHVEANSVGYDQPHILYAAPVFSTNADGGEVVGVLAGVAYLASLFPEGIDGVFCVVRGSCGKNGDGRERSFTFELTGDRPIYRGEGDDFHPAAYEHLIRRIPLFETESADYELLGSAGDDAEKCSSYIEVFPSPKYVESYGTSVTGGATATVAAAFILVALIFSVYDYLVNDRNRKITEAAERSTAVVKSLFPAQVRDRIMEGEGERRPGNSKKLSRRASTASDNDELQKKDQTDQVIADLFPFTTIMFADVVGFTSWSSAREPSQVFRLLETLYSSFDEIAKPRRIFKVETVGDCYVAACGVPTPRKDHALAIARFARAAVAKAHRVFHDLESSLGPGTGDLSLRVGIHSGPVTAGVLRGDNARFQLFGDTMNVTARIESTGIANRIHISQDTANLLVTAGKEKWVTRRDEKIEAKGKGTLQTFWLRLNSHRSSSAGTSDDISQSHASERLLEHITEVNLGDSSSSAGQIPVQVKRLVDWICPILFQKLIALSEGRKDRASDAARSEVEEQLKQYVIAVAMRYHDNPFHNFEHAIHVTMSVSKLMSRVVSGSSSHSYAKRISHDLMLQLALLFSALIHDMDHEGIPNTQLIKERPEFSARFQNQSVAEKNSVELAWDLLLQPQFEALLKFLAPSMDEFVKFRDTVELVTLSTDIMDKDLKADRNRRWALTFDGAKRSLGSTPSEHESDSLKVQIVMEHLIQASDVCHTMQHWQIYRKWNERLFREMYKAWCEGRATQSPESAWYRGEIGFFDFYIIPLAKKLADCGVFGVSSDEYLNYAIRNRAQWEEEGKEAVEAMVLKCEAEFGQSRSFPDCNAAVSSNRSRS